jgi:hypothetical protein
MGWHLEKWSASHQRDIMSLVVVPIVERIAEMHRAGDAGA